MRTIFDWGGTAIARATSAGAAISSMAKFLALGSPPAARIDAVKDRIESIGLVTCRGPAATKVPTPCRMSSRPS